MEGFSGHTQSQVTKGYFSHANFGSGNTLGHADYFSHMALCFSHVNILVTYRAGQERRGGRRHLHPVGQQQLHRGEENTQVLYEGFAISSTEEGIGGTAG
ncbi:hypothetical protein AVEN_35732-1 [Araneus ventricosus]|uniref:Uncharacterized protein n=1 Tax=Araneus ventricosus TaxID=182803 RepID=A0A4Y2W1F4_ARAVE|nr:hypothetical protein AVEN_35732-1 [Araneus ventricosus]